MSKKIFTKKEVNKLLFSETIKKSEVPWLVDLLNPETALNKSDLSHEQLQIINEIRSELLNNSSDEWVISKGPDGKLILDMGEDTGKWHKCQLCGTKNRYIHYIKNKYSDDTINIGSDCIEEFGDLGKVANKNKRSLVSAQLKNRRLVGLLGKIPNAKSRIEIWNVFLKSLEIILPMKLEEPYIKLGEKAEKLFKRILSKNKNEQEIEQLKKVFIKQDKYKEQILKHVDLNKDKSFIFSRKIDDWLMINRAKEHAEIKEMIQKEFNGCIHFEIANKINEPGFLKVLANEYSKNINSDEMRMRQTTSNGFVVSVAPFLNVNLDITNRIFSKEYGSIAYGKTNSFDNEILISNAECHSSKDKASLIEEYSEILSFINMNIVNVDWKSNRIDIKDLNIKKVYREDLERFIEKNKLLLYLNKREELKKVILKNSNSFTENNYKNLIKREKDIKASYREDINR